MSYRKPIRPIPAPTLRRGSLTYEIRIRVPDAARGGKFKASHTSRSLKTRDKGEAYAVLPGVWQTLQDEFAEEEARLAGTGHLRVNKSPDPPPAPVAALPTLSVADVCKMYRDDIVQVTWANRMERMQAIQSLPIWERTGPFDPTHLAMAYEDSLRLALDEARERITICDFSSEDWFLTYLEKSGKGVVQDRQTASIALAMAALQARTALQDDFVATRLASPDTAPAPTLPAIAATQALNAPTLSTYLAAYLARRKPSDERAKSLQAVVRDFIEYLGDRSVEA